jgi:hypothetical protein
MTHSSRQGGAEAFWAGVRGERLRLVGATSVTIVRHQALPQRAQFLNFAMDCAALVLPPKPDSVPATGEHFQLTLRREGERKPLALEADVTDIDRDSGRIHVGCRFAGLEALKAWLPTHIWNHLRRRSLVRLQPQPGEPVAVTLLSHGRKLSGNVQDISLGGMLAEFPGVRLPTMDCGQRVALHVRFPLRSEEVRVWGSIVRCSRTDDGLSCGIVMDCSAGAGWDTADDAISAFLLSRPRAMPVPKPTPSEKDANPWSGVTAEQLLEGLAGARPDQRPAIDDGAVGASAESAVEGEGVRKVSAPTPIIQFSDRVPTRPKD